MNGKLWFVCVLVFALPAQLLYAQAGAGKILSHPPLRPLPNVAKRAMDKGPAFILDPKSGNDTFPGSERGPWRTIKHAFKQLKAGDTLYLRAGVYREPIYCAIAGK